MGTINKYQELEKVLKSVNLSFSMVSENTKKNIDVLTQLSYTIGNVSTSISKMALTPMNASTALIGLFSTATKFASEFQNSIYLGAQRMALLTDGMTRGAAGVEVYRQALESIRKETNLTTTQVLSMAQAFQNGYMGNQGAAFRDNMEKNIKVQSNYYKTFAEQQAAVNVAAKLTGIYGSATSGTAYLALRSGKISNEEYLKYVTPLAAKGDLTAGREATIAQTNAERAREQAMIMSKEAIGNSDISRFTLGLGEGSAKIMQFIAGISGYGNAVAGTGLGGNILQALGLAVPKLGKEGENGLMGEKGGVGSEKNPMYVKIVGGGGVGGAGGSGSSSLEDVAKLATSQLVSRAVVRSLPIAGRLAMMAAPAISSVAPHVAAAAAAVGTMSSILAAFAAVGAVGETSLNLLNGKGGENYLSRGILNRPTEWAASGFGAAGRFLGLGSKSVEETGSRMSKEEMDAQKARNAPTDMGRFLTAQFNLGQFKLEQEKTLPLAKEIEGYNQNIISTFGQLPGFANSTSKAYREVSAQTKIRVASLEQEKDLQQKIYEAAKISGDTDKANGALAETVRLQTEIQQAKYKSVQSEIAGKTAVVEGNIKIKSQEVELARAARDRNVEFRAGIGVSYEDTMNVLGSLKGVVQQKGELQKIKMRAAAEATDPQTKKQLQLEAQRAEIEKIGAQTEYAREAKALREGYLGAFAEQALGGGGRSSLLPTMGHGNQFFAEIAQLGGIGTSGVTRAGQFTMNGLQVQSEEQKKISDKLNAGIFTREWGASGYGFEEMGGVGALAAGGKGLPMIGESGVVPGAYGIQTAPIQLNIQITGEDGESQRISINTGTPAAVVGNSGSGG